MFEERLQRAKELLKTIRHAALATVNLDGSPHNSPVFAAWDKDLNFYWASGRTTQHSKNIAHDGRVFVAIFDSVGQGGGLYVQACASVVGKDELLPALKVVNARRAAFGRDAAKMSLYTGEGPQRLYKAIYEKAWVNVTKKRNGEIIGEYRQEVAPLDLA